MNEPDDDVFLRVRVAPEHFFDDEVITDPVELEKLDELKSYATTSASPDGQKIESAPIRN